MAVPSPSATFKDEAGGSTIDTLDSASITLTGGNAVCVCIGSRDATAADSVVDAVTWNAQSLAQIVGSRIRAGESSIEWWRLREITGGSSVLTVDWAGFVTHARIAIYEIHNLITNGAIAQKAVASSIGTTLSVPITTVFVNRLLLCGFWHQNSDGPLISPGVNDWDSTQASNRHSGNRVNAPSIGTTTFQAFWSLSAQNVGSAIAWGNPQGSPGQLPLAHVA